MRSISLFIAVTLLSLSILSCKKITPSKTITSESRTVSSFEELDVENGIIVDVRYSETPPLVIVEAPENIQEYVDVCSFAGTLSISIRDNKKIKKGTEIKVHITTPYLSSVSLSGASVLSFTDVLTTSDFSMCLSGASRFKGSLNVDECDFSLSGRSDVQLSGTAAAATMDASGSSKINNYDFSINNLEIDLSGASQASLSVNSTLSVTATGASSFNYQGDPVINYIDVSGSSTINKN